MSVSNNCSSPPTVLHYTWPPEKIIRLLILVFIMCTTLIGNSYIVIELFCRRRRHYTRLHLFILNLAMGDLAICWWTMTSELVLLVFDQQWIFSNMACKLTVYIQVVTLASTTFINVAMTYDRYEAICRPFRSCTALRRVRRIIVLCWFSSFVVAIPQLFIFQLSFVPGCPRTHRCISSGYTAEWQRRVYFTTFAFYVLIIPAICMTICYVQIVRVVGSSTTIWVRSINAQPTVTSPISSSSSPAKVKTVKLALTIIVVFVLCWTPYMVATLIEIYSNRWLRVPDWLGGVFQTLCLLQSGLNPFIYISFNRQRKYSPTLALTAARMTSYTSNRRKRHRSVSSGSFAETSFRTNGHHTSAKL